MARGGSQQIDEKRMGKRGGTNYRLGTTRGRGCSCSLSNLRENKKLVRRKRGRNILAGRKKNGLTYKEDSEQNIRK